MPTIEGIGDEVVHFFIGLGLVIVCLLLWLTTRVRNADEPFFRTVYVLERRYRRSNINSDQTRVLNSINRLNEERNEHLPLQPENSQPTVTIKQTNSNEDVNSSSNSESIPVVQANTDTQNFECDNEESVIRRRRIEFYNNGSQHICNENSPTNSKTGHNSEESSSEQTDLNSIKVRLKYVNDDLRVVDGVLNERLLDFKKRNFSTELSENKLVRLIFNGRALRDDNISLQSYGFFDNCVVHCLVLNERPQQPSNAEQQEQSQQFAQSNDQTTTPEWNLSKLLCFIISGILLLTWFCRFQFAALFTFTSTSFLLGLTVIFVCSMFATFHVDSVPINSTG